MRRTIISTIYIAVAIVLAASCNKNDNPVSPADKTVITAVAEQIGAGSVVVKDIPSDSIAVGNPCKVIRNLHK